MAATPTGPNPPNLTPADPVSGAIARGLFEGAPDATVVVDATGRIALVNAQTERLFGYTRDELQGKPVEILLPERFHGVHVGHRTAYLGRPRVRHMGSGLALVARRKDGSEFPVEISLSPIETEHGTLVTSAIRDITERVRLTEELRAHRDRLEDLVAQRASELLRANAQLQQEIAEREEAESVLAQERNFFRGVVESLRDGVAILDMEQRVVGWNQALSVNSGIPIDEIRGQRFFDTFPNFRKEGLEPILARLYNRTKEAFLLERFEHVSRVTGPMTVNLKGSVIRGPAGEMVGVVLVLENITERVRLERSAQEAEKLVVVGTLAAGLAHEINNPMGIMISRIELMLTEAEESGLPQVVRDDLEVLQRNAQRVGRITQGLLSFARRAPGTKAPTDLNAVVEETLLLFETQAAKAGIKVQRGLTPKLPRVEGDANQLQQVLLNLLNNAREALQDHGEIRVETALANGRPGWLRLAVLDTGPGVPADVQSKIFVPFFTTKRGGTGLGLPISHRIVKDHGGTLEVASQPGAGATFTILLPSLPAPR